MQFIVDFDLAILSFYNVLANSVGFILTPLAKIITFLGEKGIIFFLFAIFLMFFKSSRKCGICMFGALCIGTLLTTFIIKPSVMRIRPFNENDTFYRFYEAVGCPAEDGYSFPSGHCTAAMCFAMCMFMYFKPKKSWKAFFAVLIMGFARNYLIVHYPTDVLGAVVVGFVASMIAYAIVYAIFTVAKDNKDLKFYDFLLNASIVNYIDKKKKEKTEKQKTDKQG